MEIKETIFSLKRFMMQRRCVEAESITHKYATLPLNLSSTRTLG